LSSVSSSERETPTDFRTSLSETHGQARPGGLSPAPPSKPTSDAQPQAAARPAPPVPPMLKAEAPPLSDVAGTSAVLLVDPEKILRAFRNLVPENYFREFDEVVALIDKGLSAAIRGQLLICVINGILTWIGLVIFGVKYSLILALLAGTMSLIPIFGSILSSIPIIIVALVSTAAGIDVFKGAMMLAWIIGIHLIEANLLNPKIIGTAAKIHPVVVIFAVVAGERTSGPIGALLAVPLVSAVQAVFIYLRQKARAAADAPTSSPEAEAAADGRSRS